MATVLRVVLVLCSIVLATLAGDRAALLGVCQDANVEPAESARPTAPANQPLSPLQNAHAHNDYYHDRPLLDAMEQGFCSVEADVFLVAGELLVAHSVFEIRKQSTLKRLYLDPLRERCHANDGRIYQDGPPLILLVDFKTDGEKTYAALKAMLAEYQDILMRCEDGRIIEGAVQIIVSGNRPVNTIREEVSRFVFLDGRMNDLAIGRPADLVPLVSDQWSSQFKWRGQGAMPAAEKAKLKSIVAKAHSQNRKLRFWGAPDNLAGWEALVDAQVDLINTDQLGELAEYLRHRDAAKDR